MKKLEILSEPPCPSSRIPWTGSYYSGNTYSQKNFIFEECLLVYQMIICVTFDNIENILSTLLKGFHEKRSVLKNIGNMNYEVLSLYKPTV